MSKSRFSRVEERIQQLVEGTFARLFVGRLHPLEVATRLAHALEDNAVMLDDGTVMAPNRFMVSLNPDDYAAILADTPELARSLRETVMDLANRAGMRMPVYPDVNIVADTEVAARFVAVSARYENKAIRETQALTPITAEQVKPTAPRNAQLILHGTIYIPLERPVINVGRRPDNQIVIEDPRVSRKHAQLRLRFGRYVLYDLGSSGGTFVNNHAIHESILKPGDVISLAGVTMVYIEDDTTSTDRVARDTKTETSLKRPKGLQQPRDEDPTL